MRLQPNRQGAEGLRQPRAISFEKDRQKARAALVRDYVSDSKGRSSGSRIEAAFRKLSMGDHLEEVIP